MTNQWRVVVVFDPDGTGQDFAYTVGLHELGLPELFLWARPTDGEDPGADWILGNLDLIGQLHDLAERAVAGTLTPGTRIDVTFDGGATVATMTIQPPVAAHDGRLDAFEAHPDAAITEIRWSLHRTPIGERRELTADETTRARARLAAFVSEAAAASVAFPAAARFGPHTPIVEALRLKTRSLDDPRAAMLVAAVHLERRPAAELAIVEQAARSVGLVDEVLRATALAIDDAHAVCSRVFAAEADMVPPTTELLAAIFAVTYGSEITRHARIGERTAASEVLWSLLDPDAARTVRFVHAVAERDPRFHQLVAAPDLGALAATVDPIDDETASCLHDLWVLTAAEGHGSGLWLAALLIDPTTTWDVVSAAGLALAVFGFHTLSTELPGQLADLEPTIRRVADAVGSTAMRKAG